MRTGASLYDIAASVREFIREPVAPAEAEFNRLALEVFRFQFENNIPYRRFSERAGKTPETVDHWRGIPAIVTSAFKDLDLSALPARARTIVFHSSGTTEHRPSRHYHSEETVHVYEEALIHWFKPHVLPDLSRMRFVVLSPRSSEVPNSSLAHMFKVVSGQFGTESFFVGKLDGERNWTLDFDAIENARNAISKSSEPVVICGTAFSFVHWCDALGAENRTVRLPAGSRVFETGGYKGRSRTIPKAELHQMIESLFGVSQSQIISEYGMSELSSQAYDRVAGSRAARVFRFPPWVRAVVLSPETLEPVGDGETGLVRVYDLANIGSVLAIQTEDLAMRRDDGFELIGRAALAESRGCSLLEMSS